MIPYSQYYVCIFDLKKFDTRNAAHYQSDQDTIQAHYFCDCESYRRIYLANSKFASWKIKDSFQNKIQINTNKKTVYNEVYVKCRQKEKKLEHSDVLFPSLKSYFGQNF
jgi:hypothetical protein